MTLQALGRVLRRIRVACTAYACGGILSFLDASPMVRSRPTMLSTTRGGRRAIVYVVPSARYTSI